MYALKTKGRLSFEHVSESLEKLDERVKESFSLWKIMQPKGSNPQMLNYMKTRERVKITIEKLDD
jgi:hypothetical protein